MTAIPVLAVVAGASMVRLGWGGRTAVAVLGWLVTAAALGVLAREGGAWGATVGTVTGMVAALVLLVGSGGNPPMRARGAERARAIAATTPDPVALLRRLSVFLLVVPVGGGAALWLAFAIQAAVRARGTNEADANACLLFLLPTLWCILLVWQMTRDGPRHMLAPPLLAAGLGALLWLAR